MAKELVTPDDEGQGEIVENPIVRPDNQEIDIQIATARRYPRSLKTFRQTATSMATFDEETAASCFYVLQRGGKKIDGPGIRLAEIVANSWGNLRCGGRVIGEDEGRKNIVAEAFAHDLQTNTHIAIRILRRIVDKHGRRYKDDMIAMTGNAAVSIALRNAIFKVVPFTYVQSIYLQAKKLAIGDASSLSERRQKMLDYFAKFGVDNERLLARLGKPSIEDIGLDDIELLIGISTALKEGSTDLDTEFPKPDDGKPKNLADKVKSKAKAKKAEAESQGGELFKQGKVNKGAKEKK